MNEIQQTDREKLMAEGNTFKLILRFSIPTIMGMLATAYIRL